jgi:hypothetical protein
MSGVWQKFLNGFSKIKTDVEDFKAKHKMASTAISTGIELLPDPFNKVASIIWDGMEKNDDSADKMLEILKRIEDSDENSFDQISSMLKQLLDNNASKKDIQELGEEIRTSSQSILSNLRSGLYHFRYAIRC